MAYRRSLSIESSARRGSLPDRLRPQALVPLDQVTVRSAEAATFPNAGLGCPVPGMAYPQVQVDGYRVAVAAGATYDYRGTSPGDFRLCAPQK